MGDRAVWWSQLWGEIYLVGVGGEETSVTEVSHSISVHIILVEIPNKRTVVLRHAKRREERERERR